MCLDTQNRGMRKSISQRRSGLGDEGERQHADEERRLLRKGAATRPSRGGARQPTGALALTTPSDGGPLPLASPRHAVAGARAAWVAQQPGGQPEPQSNRGNPGPQATPATRAAPRATPATHKSFKGQHHTSTAPAPGLSCTGAGAALVLALAQALVPILHRVGVLVLPLHWAGSALVLHVYCYRALQVGQPYRSGTGAVLRLYRH